MKDDVVCECQSCQHHWVVARLPMDVIQLADLLTDLDCPRCCGDEVFVVFDKGE